MWGFGEGIGTGMKERKLKESQKLSSLKGGDI